jgi:hypothetical protein
VDIDNDIITLGKDVLDVENYARRDPSVGKESLSGGDPLFFFRMYGTRREVGETWHSYQVGTGGFGGAILSSPGGLSGPSAGRSQRSQGYLVGMAAAVPTSPAVNARRSPTPT